MQSVSSRIWTRVAVSISYDDSHYTTGTSSMYLLLFTVGLPYNRITKQWYVLFGTNPASNIQQKQKLYGYLPPITQTPQVKLDLRATHDKHSLNRQLHVDAPVLVDQQGPTYNRSVRTLDEVKGTCQEQWQLRTDGKRDSGNFMLSARIDDEFLRQCSGRSELNSRLGHTKDAKNGTWCLLA